MTQADMIIGLYRIAGGGLGEFNGTFTLKRRK